MWAGVNNYPGSGQAQQKGVGETERERLRHAVFEEACEQSTCWKGPANSQSSLPREEAKAENRVFPL